MQIKDRVAVITGAASGLGHATTVDLISRDVKVVAMVDMNDDVDEIAAQMN